MRPLTPFPPLQNVTPRPSALQAPVLFTLLVLATLLLPACDEGGPTQPTSPAYVELLSGDGQAVVAGGLFPETVVVEVRDEADRPVPDQLVMVRVDQGDGWAPGPNPRTDEDGRVRLPWYAGTEPGVDQRLRLSAGGISVTVHGEVLTPVPGVSYTGHRAFVEYIPGSLPLVITAPHGGTLRPGDIPEREWGTMVRDYATDDMAYRLADALEERVGARPHLILLHLHRTRLDANRDLEEAAQGNPLAERAWHEFHHWTEVAMKRVKADHGEGFYMDLHGHGKHDDFELGYLLTRSDLEATAEELDQEWAVSKSSLRTLAEDSSLPFSQLIRGEESLGTLYEEEGYTSVPSPVRPYPSGPFFSGGYNTRRHGCREGGAICGYQLELNRENVRDNPVNRQAFAEAHARVMERFFKVHYGVNLANLPPAP